MKYGSPPHARGRRKRGVDNINSAGITPACAGKTPANVMKVISFPDHPRMRGEDVEALLPPLLEVGSPPHARGRRGELAGTNRTRRITPACAGKTFAGPDPKSTDTGSPPHARGRQLDSPGNPAKSFSSLPVFFCSQPSPLGWFLRWVLGLGSSLWKQH